MFQYVPYHIPGRSKYLVSYEKCYLELAENYADKVRLAVDLAYLNDKMATELSFNNY